MCGWEHESRLERGGDFNGIGGAQRTQNLQNSRSWPMSLHYLANTSPLQNRSLTLQYTTSQVHTALYALYSMNRTNAAFLTWGVSGIFEYFKNCNANNCVIFIALGAW